jgi:hypothetical protein
VSLTTPTDTAADRQFDRVFIPRLRPAQRNYLLAPEPEKLTAAQERALERGYKNWAPPPIYDQGSEGACVGFGAVSVRNSGDIRPKPLLTNVDAFNIYRLAQRHDEWPGEGYSGTSVNGGCLALRELGHITRFDWAFDIESAIRGLLIKGPGYGGFDWTTGMSSPDADGYVRATGSVRGGHSVGICSINTRVEYKINRKPFRGRVKISQSWSKAHGKNGFIYLPLDDLAVLIDGFDYPGELAFLTEVAPQKAA